MNSKSDPVEEDIVTITNCSSSASNSEKSEDTESSKEISRRLPRATPQPLNGFDDSDLFMNGSQDDFSVGDIRWIFNNKAGTFSAVSKMVEQNKRYEQKLVLPVDPSICNSEESVGLHLHRNIFSQAFQQLTFSTDHKLPLPSSHTAYFSNNEKVTLHDGRYKSEFEEIRTIGRGGFAKVTEVRHKVDKQNYAVKSVPVKSPGKITLEKLSQEVTILAKLTRRPSQRIVRYHAAWLEEEYTSDGSHESCRQKRSKPSPMMPSSSGSSSSSANDDDNLEKSNSIVFEDSNTCHVEHAVSTSKISKKNTRTISKQEIYVYEKEENIVDGELGLSVVKNQRRQVVNCHQLRQTTSSEAVKRRRRRHPSKPMTKYVLYIQMELCGKTLSEWLLQRNEKMPSNDQFTCVNFQNNIHILRQILEGIHFVHQQDILHRDLKPLNVFLTMPHLHVKIGDFGLAREVVYQEDEELESNNPKFFGRQLSSDIGTSPYIAPEQQDGGDYDSKADMYSFGIIKYEMFHPFQTGHERIICIRRLREQEDIPEELKECWPEEANMIKDLTSRNKIRRPSASEVLKSSTYCGNRQQTKAALRHQLCRSESLVLRKDKELDVTKEELEKVKMERDKERRENDQSLEEKDKEIQDLKDLLNALKVEDSR